MSEKVMIQNTFNEIDAEISKYREGIVAEYGNDVEALTTAFAVRVYKEQRAKRLSDSALGMFVDASKACETLREEVRDLTIRLGKAESLLAKAQADEIWRHLYKEIEQYFEGVNA